ncbi:hypothetical protein [Limnohabitans sp.]|nr:hypothetical protein [Limnohabitans sp.]
MNPQCRNFSSGIFFAMPCFGVHCLVLAKPKNIEKKQTGKKKAL